MGAGSLGAWPAVEMGGGEVIRDILTTLAIVTLVLIAIWGGLQWQDAY